MSLTDADATTNESIPGPAGHNAPRVHPWDTFADVRVVGLPPGVNPRRMLWRAVNEAGGKLSCTLQVGKHRKRDCKRPAEGVVLSGDGRSFALCRKHHKHMDLLESRVRAAWEAHKAKQEVEAAAAERASS